MIAVLLGVLLFMSLVMAAAWLTVRATGNGGWTDVFWTFGTGAAGVACALIPVEGVHSPLRQGLVAALVGLWSLRLGLYITRRVSSGVEDVRYRRLRELWGPRFNQQMVWMLMVQAPATTLLCLSIRLAAAKPAPGLGLTDLLGLAILAVAIAGEGIADRQMKVFKADPANRGKVADSGMWGWSRHPNYVFEWLGWLAYPVIAIQVSGYPQGWLALAGPAFMYLILTRVTGVPPLESAMVESKGEAYRRYQSRVPAFFPIPLRKSR